MAFGIVTILRLIFPVFIISPGFIFGSLLIFVYFPPFPSPNPRFALVTPTANFFHLFFHRTPRIPPEDKTKRNPSKPNRKKKFQSTRKLLDDSKPLDRTQSLSLFSSLKSDRPAKLAPPDLPARNPAFGSDLNPHTFLDSLRSDSPGDPNDGSLGNTAFSFASSKSNLGDDYLDPSKSLDLLPGPPRDLKAPLVEARFVVLSWKPPLNGDDIVTYSVYYRQEGSER